MKSQKRICLFAGFDKKGEIADYVVYYLKALSQFADVYYWGDFESSEVEKNKLKPYCKGVYCAKHGKYDFGSWQELIQKLGREKIETYDELILANDSCYGPLFDFDSLFTEMDSRDCDFWGLSAAFNQHIHLQSYYIVLKQPILRSPILYDFFARVKSESNYNEVCLAYEDRFTYVLSKSGFRFSSFIEYRELENHPYKDIVSAIKRHHFPLLKVKFFLGGIRDQAGVEDWRKVIKDYTNYPVDLIENDLERRGFDLTKIDKSVREKRSETPSSYTQKSRFKHWIKKGGKFILKPVFYFTDAYVYNRTARYSYKIEHINQCCRQLQQKYDELRSSMDPNYIIKTFYLQEPIEPCRLTLSENDATLIKNFALELPLTSESTVLLLGNITPQNLDSLGLYNAHTLFLNNNWESLLKIHSERTKNLCNFNFIDELKRPVYFDFILVQPLLSESTDALIKKFLSNLERQMMFESILVMMVRNKEEAKYRKILQDSGFNPVKLEKGLVVGNDPFDVYCDKIKSIKGYKALFYKIK